MLNPRLLTLARCVITLASLLSAASEGAAQQPLPSPAALICMPSSVQRSKRTPHFRPSSLQRSPTCGSKRLPTARCRRAGATLPASVCCDTPPRWGK